MVAAIRRVLGETGWDCLEVARPAPGEANEERLAHITGLLAEAQRARYREFTGMMARSSMPPAAISKIV